jgi:hypothetical protein
MLPVDRALKSDVWCSTIEHVTHLSLAPMCDVYQPKECDIWNMRIYEDMDHACLIAFHSIYVVRW